MAEETESREPNEAVSAVVHRNIAAMMAYRAHSDAERPLSERVADAITAFAGSMKSVVLHAILFGFWIVANAGFVPGVPKWDPYPFVMLAMWASVEAIFLTSFVLVSQNRMARLQDKRADLDLQVSLLSEHEVTRLIRMVDAIAKQVGAEEETPPGVEPLKSDVRPEVVLQEMERAERGDDPRF